MTTPTKEISRLDRFLRTYGSGVGNLQRITGTPPSQVTFTIALPSHVRKYDPKELTPSIIQGDSRVIISPTLLTSNNWPGDTSSEGFIHRGDKWIWLDGKTYNVEAAEHIRLDSTLVKIIMQVRG